MSLNISKWQNSLSNIANTASPSIVLFTKSFNEVVGSTPVDAYVDSISGIGHRIKFGHSLDHLPEIYSKFGVNGVGDYLSHGLRDLMSPHGMHI